MRNEKRIKILIVVSLFLLEAFVWSVPAFLNCNAISGSDMQIIGGADGPTAIFVAGSGHKDGAKKPISPNPPVDDSKPIPAVKPSVQADPKDPQPESGKTGEELLAEAKENGLLILVNKDHPVDKDYKPNDLMQIKYFAPDRAPQTRYMRKEAAKAFDQLVEQAAKEGLEFKMTTAFRSFDFQKMLYDGYVAKQGEEEANKFSAKPGQSEHQTGLSVDVSSPSVDFQLSDDYGATKEGKWLAAHASEYGFIIRFPKGKEDVTGYQYEPWHLRYVGLTAAKEIYEQHLTLEEYLQENNLQ